MADALADTILTRARLPGLLPFPWSQTLAIFAHAMVSSVVGSASARRWDW